MADIFTWAVIVCCGVLSIALIWEGWKRRGY